MANKEVQELTASEYYFLTLGAGLTLQKDDKVIFKKDLAERTLKELLGAQALTLTDEFKFDFVDGDVAVDPTNTITETAHGMSNGDPVKLSSDGVLPAGLSSSVDYYIVSANANDFQLSLSVGGAAVVITAAAGGGTHTVHKLRASLQYSNFEIIKA